MIVNASRAPERMYPVQSLRDRGGGKGRAGGCENVPDFVPTLCRTRWYSVGVIRGAWGRKSPFYAHRVS